MSRDAKPWLPLYVDDFLGDETVKLAGNRSLGAYVKLLCHQWRHRSVPAALKQLAKIAGETTKDFARLWPEIEDKFPERDDRRVNPRLEVERKKADRKLAGLTLGARRANAKRALSVTLGGTLKAEDVHAHAQSQKTSSRGKREAPTWLTPFLTAWLTVYPESAPPKGMLAKWLRPLVDKHPPELVASRLVTYLRANGQFATLPKFAATFGAENGSPPTTVTKSQALDLASRMGVSVDPLRVPREFSTLDGARSWIEQQGEILRKAMGEL